LQLARIRYDLTYRALVVGILNRTHDSFYDGGRHLPLDALLRRAERLIGDGADLLEVGARPGGVGVSEVPVAAEADLVVESVCALRARFDAPLAVDTRRAAVAAAAFDAGAVLGNDMSGFRDRDYLAAARRAGASVVATHCRLPPGVPDPDPHYVDVVGEVRAGLAGLVEQAENAGLRRDRIVVDPGLDLGKTWQQSLQLLGCLARFADLGCPVLLAASHKIFLGRLLNLPVDERGDATTAATTAGVLRGARLLRVHDARPARHAADLAEALLRIDAGAGLANRQSGR
jgi:dihydropteroate synthase